LGAKLANRRVGPSSRATLVAAECHYLPKPFDVAELLARIPARRSSAAQFPSLEAPHLPYTHDMILDLRVNAVTVRHSGKTARLTPSEMRLLHCLLSAPGCTVTRGTIISRVWGSASIGGSNA